MTPISVVYTAIVEYDVAYPYSYLIARQQGIESLATAMGCDIGAVEANLIELTHLHNYAPTFGLARSTLFVVRQEDNL